MFANRKVSESIKLFVTASNDSGEKATFGIGSMSCTNEIDEEAKRTIGDFDLKKEGLHFTKMAFTRNMTCALDNESGLWLWDAPPRAKTRKLFYP